MFETNKIFGKDFECTLQDGMTDFLQFTHQNGTSITLKNLQCNDFNEDGALVQKLKVHSSLDNYSASAELFQTIPFGTEFEIKRNFDFADSFARVIVDINPGIGAVEKLNLEDFEIKGDFKTLNVFLLNDNKIELKSFELSEKNEIFQSGSTLILAFNVSSADGNAFECGLGNDLWRHNIAESFDNCDANFLIEGNKDKLTFKRTMFNFQFPENAPRKRQWRFKYYFAWLNQNKTASVANYEKINLHDLIGKEFEHVNSFAGTPCITAPLCRRVLRNTLRKTPKHIEVEAILALCDDASHLERSNIDQLLHWGIDDFFELMIWATKLLAKNNLLFKFSLQNDILSSLIGLQVLNKNLENCIETE